MKHFRSFALLSGAMLLHPAARAQGPAAPGALAICTVTHIDFMPNHTEAYSALEAYVAREQQDKDLSRVQLLQAIDRPNHFTLLETFRDKATYDHHIEADYTRAFRARIAATLGSPYDEQLFRPHPVP